MAAAPLPPPLTAGERVRLSLASLYHSTGMRRVVDLVQQVWRRGGGGRGEGGGGRGQGAGAMRARPDAPSPPPTPQATHTTPLPLPIIVLGEACATADEAKAALASVPWFTYRSALPPLPGGLTTDAGWGCTLRSGQMLLAAGLARRAVGQGWRKGEGGGVPAELDAALAVLADAPDAPLSMHAIVAAGAAHGVTPGRWLGPAAFCGAAAAAAAAAATTHPSLPLPTLLVVGADGGGGAPTLPRSPPGHGPWLLLLPLTLGLGAAVNPAYLPPLAAAMTLPASLGALAGRPGAALFVAGTSGEGGAAAALVLDPHDVRPSTAPLVTFAPAPRSTPLAGLDPSLALGFWCGGAGEYEGLASSLDALAAAHPRAVLVTVGDAVVAGPGGRTGLGGGSDGGFELL